MDANVEQQVRALAMSRIGLGVAFVLAPGVGLRSWLGKGTDGPSARLAVRMLGGRDIALGIGTMLALRHGAPVRGWLEAGALSDATDVVGTVMAAKHLPKGRVLSAGLSAAGAVVMGRRLVSQLPPSAG